MSVSIIIPAYNEEARIGSALDRLSRFKDYEVIVVADGSFDRTVQIARERQVKVIESERRLGKGAAITTAVKQAKGDIIVTMDVDQPAWNIPCQLSKFEETNADLLIGKRVYDVDPPLSRRIATRLFRGFAQFLFGSLPDTQSGFKIFRKQVLLDLADDIKLKGYLWDLELYLKVKQRGCKIVESEIGDSWDPESKIKVLQDGAVMAKDLMKLRISNLKMLDLSIICFVVSIMGYMIALTVSTGYLNGADAWFHILVARAWFTGLNGMISPVVMEINMIPYPPLFHFILRPFMADLQTAVTAAKVLQILLYPLGLLFNMLLARKYVGSQVAIIYGFLLSGTYYAFAMSQARPQSLAMLLFPIAVWSLLENKTKTFVVVVAATFYSYSPLSIGLTSGLLLYAFRRNKKALKVWATVILVAPIVLYQASFIFNKIVFDRWLSAGDVGMIYETNQFFSNPLFWMLNGLGISIIGLVIIPFAIFKWKQLSEFNKVLLFSLGGFLLLLPIWYMRVFHFAIMPLALFTAQFVLRQKFNLKYVLLAIIIVQAILFAFVPVWWLSIPPYLDKYW